VTVLPFELRSLDEMEGVFERMAQTGVQAVPLGPDGLLFQGRNSLQKFALARGMPTCGWSRETLISGLRLSYGPDQVEMAHHVPIFADKICSHTSEVGDEADMPRQLNRRE
jgi:hypothetical protein